MEATPPAAPEYLAYDGAAAAVAPEAMRGGSDVTNNKSVVTDQFLVEEFFDFSNEEDEELVLSDNANANEFQSIKAESGSSVTLLVDSSCNSSLGDFGNSNLTSELCVPYDDLAELEWVSTFAEESFSSEDIEKLQLISGMSARPEEAASATHGHRPDPNPPKYRPEILVPGKARSKRPRTAPGSWSSRILLVSDDPKPVRKPKPVKKFNQAFWRFLLLARGCFIKL
uniref:GATA transcription factor n=1 Tax=Kalanchoe fedtschenkoi TaxID=63787 RepID=A0A7N0UCY2_KALFE